MDFDFVERCGHCCSSLLDHHSENEEPTKKLKISNNFCDTVTEIQIWNALEFIYGVSWESFQNYQLGKNNGLFTPQENIKFCSGCASLLSANYNTHLKFENACRPSSLVELLKEFRYNNDNCPTTLPQKLVSNHQGGNQYCSELMNEEIMENHVKEDLFDNFTFEETEDDGISSEKLIETKYETIPPVSIDTSVSYKSESKTLKEGSLMSRKATLRSRNLVIKVEKLSPEEILQFSNHKTVTKNLSRKKTATIPYKLPNVTKTKKSTEKLSEVEIQKRVAEALEKVTDKNEFKKIVIAGRFVCSACGKSFKNYETLKYKHWRIHTGKNYVCDLCGKTTSLMRLLEHHKIRKHGTDEEKNKWKIKCTICEEFVYKFDLQPHIFKSHPKNPPPRMEKYKCKECGVEYKSKQSFSNHILTHTEGPQQCDICSKFLPTSIRLESHKNKVHGKKNFCCEKCPMSFVDLRRLKDHEISHQDIRQHVCHECGKSFKYRQHFYTHLKWHKDIREKGEGAFTCDLCNDGKTFKDNKSLREHKRRMHFGGKIHQCSFCGKRLFSPQNVRIHEKMHIEMPGFKPRVRQKLPGHMKASQGEAENVNL